MNKVDNLPKLGMRNVKTVIAVFLCIVILRFLNIKYPFYACIAAVITMQNSVENSFTIGLNRIIGTLIGATVGVLCSLISHSNLLLISIGISVVIYCTNLLNRKRSTTIACIVFLAIMVNLQDTTPVYYSILRVFETIVGIIIAVLVNSKFLPPKVN